MAKLQKIFACQQCGATSSKWKGKCDGCGAWNAYEEELIGAPLPRSSGAGVAPNLRLVPINQSIDGVPIRWQTSISEFDRVLGGGLVPGAMVLMGGEPGIGKSTLLLQVVGKLGQQVPCLYFTGEEGVEQIQQRAERLGVQSATLSVGAVAQVESVLELLRTNPEVKVVVIDSIQTLYTSMMASAPGTVGQIRQCTAELLQAAKARNIAMILVGHVTKDGNLAGPRLLEHMVDTVLYFEGDRSHTFRLLRGVKNRFGPTHELGVFQMGTTGLEPVDNPSSLFLPERERNVSGSAIFAGLEGTRPLLVEVEALVAQASYPNPRRAVVGWDANRLAMVLAVLEARCGLNLGTKDIYLNVVGGLKLNDPAADLPVAMALASSAYNKPLPDRGVFLGEVGLSGELRPVRHADLRCREAARLGFSTCYGAFERVKSPSKDIRLVSFKSLKEAMMQFH